MNHTNSETTPSYIKANKKKTPSGPLKCVPFWPRISSPERRPKREGRRRRWVSKRLELVLEIRCSWWPRDAQEIEVQGEGQGETSLKLVINHLPAGLVDSFERLGTDTWNYVLKSLVIYTDYATTILMEGRGYYSPNKEMQPRIWLTWLGLTGISIFQSYRVPEHPRANLVGNSGTRVRSAMMSFLCRSWCELSHSSNSHRNCIMIQ